MIRLKGLALYTFTVSLIILFCGVALMYMLPEYIINTLNATGVFNTGTCYAYNTSAGQCGTAATNCCEWLTYHNADEKAGQVRSLGFVVIIIAVVFMIFSVMGSGSKK